MTIDHGADVKRGLTVAALFYGLFLLFLVLVAAGAFGVGAPELVIWLVLVAGWVSFWTVKRRRR
jgi:positive regulator of sigma E activity